MRLKIDDFREYYIICVEKTHYGLLISAGVSYEAK